MVRQPRRRTHWGIFPLAGWLFTDLLLALMVVFLVASASGIVPKPMPTPVPTVVPLPCLERTSTTMSLSVDVFGLLDNSPSAIASVQQEVRAFAPIQGRRAGLVLTYDGSPGFDGPDEDRANAVANKVNAVLQGMGSSKYVFIGTAYHDPLYSFGDQPSVVKVEIYLFALPGKCQF